MSGEVRRAIGIVLAAADGDSFTNARQGDGMLRMTRPSQQLLFGVGSNTAALITLADARVAVGSNGRNVDMDIEGAATVASTLYVGGSNTYLASNLAVMGTTTLGGNLDLANNLTVRGTTLLSNAATVVGPATMQADLTVDGAATVGGTTELQSNLVVRGGVTCSNAATIVGVTSLLSDMTLQGLAMLQSNMVVQGVATFSNATTVVGAATLRSNLNVHGATDVVGVTELRSNLTVHGRTSISNAIDVTGDATLRSDVTVQGVATLSNATTIVGATSLRSDLTVQGNTLLSNATSIVGPSTLHSDLTVQGTTLLSNATSIVGPATLWSDMTVQGSATVMGTTALRSNLAVVGPVALQSNLAVSGAMTAMSDVAVQGETSTSGILILPSGSVPNAGGSGSAFDPVLRMTAAPSGSVRFTTSDGSEVARVNAEGVLSSPGVQPVQDGAGNCGAPSRRWAAVYAVNGVLQTSDERHKRDVQPCALGLEFVQGLRPVSFRWAPQADDAHDDPRPHCGFLAQQVAASALRAGMPDMGALETREDGMHSLNYTELIAPLVGAVQQLAERVAALEARCSTA